MSKIIIKEQGKQSISNKFSVAIIFNDLVEFDNLTVLNSLTIQNKKKLEWHFEQYIHHPYLKDVEPQEAEIIIREEGENLFSQLFSQLDVYNQYRETIRDGLNNLVIEICGSPEFHSLHWEALKDPNFPRAFALDVLILRKDLKPQSLFADVRETESINLLVVTSRPRGRKDVGYRTITRPLVELLRNSQLPIMVHILRPATYESLGKHLDQVGKGFYHVVHFDVHGALVTFEDFEKIEKEISNNNLTFQIQRYGRPEIKPYEGKDAYLFFDLYHESKSKGDDDFYADPVRADELANLLLTNSIPLIILNACQSGKELGEQNHKGVLPIAEETSLASRLMQAGAQMVLAMSYSVTVTAAEILMKTLYQEIFRGKSLHQAIQLGRKELANRKQRRAAFNFQVSLEDWLLPVVYQKRNVELKTKKLSAQEEEFFLNERSAIGNMPTVEYGFHGRDIDILNIERRVLLKNNILLIRGMGGAGKTTLLNHLMWWWKTTGFIGKEFYFGYDEKAYTRQEIIFRIAEKLYDRFEFSTFQAMNERAQIQKIALKLRNERHLLILDNLESIQGGYFAIKNTLSLEEQAKLKDFLVELRGVNDAFQEQTIVLLGSRSEEEWLAKGTFDKNLYDLGGLDEESATQFAEEILRQNGTLQHKVDDNFKKLFNLLAGFPLPMKVILENLNIQTPAETLDALKSGDVDLKTGTMEEKNADILKCIEYSHSNLAPERQELLLCLAPFTSVINHSYFHYYIEELKKHDAVSHLQHELWDEVFNESIRRGLMSQQDEHPIFHLQPTLPYFLKAKWQKRERTNFKQAIQTAFRAYYDGISSRICDFMDSKSAEEKIFGRALVSLEFENIDTCLEYSLNAQTSILNPYHALSSYYDFIQNNQAGLDLGIKVIKRIKTYSSATLVGTLGIEFIHVLDNIATRQFNLKMYKEAESSYQEALKLHFANKSFDDEKKEEMSASLYHSLGRIAQEGRNLDNAKEFYEKALKIQIKFKDIFSQARTLHQLGVIAQENGDLESANEYYIKALKFHDDLSDPFSKSTTLHQLGRLARELEKFEVAKNYYAQAANIRVEFSDPYLLAPTLHELGIVAQEQGEFEVAKAYCNQALEIYLEYDDIYEQASTFQQLGIIAQKEREFTKANEYFNKALEIYKAFNITYEQADILYHLGMVECEQKKFKKAEFYYKQALEIDSQYNNFQGQISTLIEIGKLKKTQNEVIEVQGYLLEALKVSNTTYNKYKINVALFYLRDLWKASNDDNLLIKVGEILRVNESEIRILFEKEYTDS